jgi:hypothetical protein
LFSLQHPPDGGFPDLILPRQFSHGLACRISVRDLSALACIKGPRAGRSSLKLPSYDDELAIEFESSATNPRNSWLRLRYAIRDYWTGEQHQIDDKIYLTASRPWFGGQRWWFVCPNENRRVRKLYLPRGARRFRSRGAYRLAYASQRETVHDRAMRRAQKLCRRLGDDPMDGHYPEKPPRMRGATYDRLLNKLIAADRVADERMLLLASKLGAGRPPRRRIR